MPFLETDVGRDRLELQIRLDKVVLAVQGHDGAAARAELTPADARRLAGMLADAAGEAEQTPRT